MSKKAPPERLDRILEKMRLGVAKTRIAQDENISRNRLYEILRNAGISPRSKQSDQDPASNKYPLDPSGRFLDQLPQK